MHHHVHILNPIEYPGWNDLLISSQGYNFFHTSAWAKVLCETYHYRPVYFALPGSGKFLALAPMMEVRSMFTGRRGVCLPFTDHCEIISDNGARAEDIISFMKEYGREHRWQFIELRCGNYPNQTPATFFYEHILDLTIGPEQLFQRLRSDERSSIRKAIREGVKVNIHRSAGAVRDFYRLHCITRKRHGLPPQPFYFFQKVYEHVVSKNLGLIILAYHNNTNIAGAVYFAFGDKCIYKFAASDYAYQHLRANNLVMWEAIKWHAENGYRSMCLGRTEPDNPGLRKFKKNWGAEERILNYYRYNLRQGAFVAQTQVVRNAHHHIFRAMPIPLLRLCGSVLYKHIG